MITAEMEKSTSPRNAPVLTGLVVEKQIAALQVWYDALKEGEKTFLVQSGRRSHCRHYLAGKDGLATDEEY